MRWEWTDRNPARSAKPPTLTRQTIVATSPEAVAKVIAAARAYSDAMGLYLWLVMVTGVRRGELCGMQIRDVDLDRGLIHVAFNYVVRAGQRIRKDTKTHQDRWLAIDPVTCALIAGYLAEIKAELAAVGVELRDDAYLCRYQRAPGRQRRRGARASQRIVDMNPPSAPEPEPRTSPESEPERDDRAARLDELLARADQSAQRFAAQQAERQASSPDRRIPPSRGDPRASARQPRSDRDITPATGIELGFGTKKPQRPRHVRARNRPAQIAPREHRAGRGFHLIEGMVTCPACGKLVTGNGDRPAAHVASAGKPGRDEQARLAAWRSKRRCLQFAGSAARRGERVGQRHPRGSVRRVRFRPAHRRGRHRGRGLQRRRVARRHGAKPGMGGVLSITNQIAVQDGG